MESSRNAHLPRAINEGSATQKEDSVSHAESVVSLKEGSVTHAEGSVTYTEGSVTGHDFSRADTATRIEGALAPAETFALPLLNEADEIWAIWLRASKRS